MENLENLKLLFETLNEAVYIVDKNRKILYFNPMATQISGFSKEETENTYCYNNILNHVDDHGKHLCIEGCPLSQAIADNKIVQQNVYLHHKAGHRVKVQVTVYPYISQGEIVGAIEVFTNIVQNTLSLKNFDDMEKLSIIDPLTKLYNRRVIDKILQDHFTYHNYQTLGVLFIDFDHFKNINDTYGHQYGDKVLVAMTQTILHNIRENDVAVRYGGDEIVIFLLDIDKTNLLSIADNFRVLLEESGPRDVSKILAASIGAVIKKEAESILEVIHRADQAMYDAKKNGGNQVIFK